MRVRALDDFYYSQDRKCGDVFDIDDAVHVQMLTMNRKIEAVNEDAPQPAKRGRYRRADLRADE